MMERRKVRGTRGEGVQEREGEQGFMLLGLIVAIAIVLLMLSVAAPRVAFELRREREQESARRADQYVRAIRKYYVKNGRYPGSMEQLENTNRVRYLRQRYVDPLTGKADYRVIGVGQNKTTVKSFFGEPLAGIASTGLGSAAGMQSAGVGGPAGAGGGSGAFGAGGASSAFGAGATGPANPMSSADSFGASSGSTGFGSSSGAGGSSGAAGPTGLGSAAGMASQGMPGSSGNAPFMGVGSSASGSSIIEPNEQTEYQSWEFLYDPRIEQLKAKAGLNGGAGSVGAGALGQTPGAGTMGTPGATSPFGVSTPMNSTTPTGTSGGPGPGGTTNPSQP